VSNLQAVSRLKSSVNREPADARREGATSLPHSGAPLSSKGSEAGAVSAALKLTADDVDSKVAELCAQLDKLDQPHASLPRLPRPAPPTAPHSPTTSWLLERQEALVIGQTDCGMLSFTNDELRTHLREPSRR
jgi:hypothetical protein